MSTGNHERIQRSAEALAALCIYRGGVEHVPGGFEAFCTEGGALVSLGTWPTWVRRPTSTRMCGEDN